MGCSALQMRGEGGAPALAGPSLAAAVFGGKTDGEGTALNLASQHLTPKEVEHLLKRGAYEVFHDGDVGADKEDDAAAANRASSEAQEDIMSILQRSTTLLRYEDGRTSAATDGADAGAAAAASTFSKASFVTADAG